MAKQKVNPNPKRDELKIKLAGQDYLIKVSFDNICRVDEALENTTLIELADLLDSKRVSIKQVKNALETYLSVNGHTDVNVNDALKKDGYINVYAAVLRLTLIHVGWIDQGN